LQRGRNCIGIPGVWAFRDKDGKYDVQSRELWSDIRLFHWAGRRTYLGFDSDYKDNPSVRNALYLLSFTLKILKADIRFCSWEGAKGIDDIIYLHRTGDAEKILTEIEEKSVTLEDFVSESHLNEIMYALTEIVSASDSIIEPENLVSIVSNKLKLRRDKVWKEIRHREHKKKQNESSPADKKTITALDPYRIKDDGSVVVVKEINGKKPHNDSQTLHSTDRSGDFRRQWAEDPAMRFVIVGGNKGAAIPENKIILKQVF
jgi:predicted transcriptional regulator